MKRSCQSKDLSWLLIHLRELPGVTVSISSLFLHRFHVLLDSIQFPLEHCGVPAVCVQAILKLCHSHLGCIWIAVLAFLYFWGRKLRMTVQVTINNAWLYSKLEQLQTFTCLSLELASVTAASAQSAGGLVKCQPLQACQPKILLVGLMTVKEPRPVYTLYNPSVTEKWFLKIRVSFPLCSVNCRTVYLMNLWNQVGCYDTWIYQGVLIIFHITPKVILAALKTEVPFFVFSTK